MLQGPAGVDTGVEGFNSLVEIGWTGRSRSPLELDKYFSRSMERWVHGGGGSREG